MSSNPRAELSAPYYPLPYDIKVATITKRGVEILLAPSWEGFATCEGHIEQINSDRRSAHSYILKRGDYACITHSDLKVLLRIGPPREVRKYNFTKKSEYKGSLLSLWLGDSSELKFLAISALAASWILGSFTVGLLQHGDQRPQKFSQLPENYNLPFIHSEHFKNAPESLQSNYDPNAPLKSVLDFSHSFVDTLLNNEAKSGEYNNKVLFPESREHYKKLYAKQNQAIAELIENRKIYASKILSDNRNALLSVPYIKGESFTEDLIRISEKLSLWYKSSPQNSILRNQAAKIFRNDAIYNPKQYKDLEKSTEPEPKISDDNTEKVVRMFADAQAISEKSREMRSSIIKNRSPVQILSPQLANPIPIEEKSNFVQLTTPEDFGALNQKFRLIRAAVFDPDKPKIVREPLIGTLDPKKIQQTVDKYRFELQLCYELALRRNQQVAGSMEWQWHLDSAGDVYDIELLQSNIRDEKMIQCVKQKIGSWTWPRPQKGSILVSFPFYFKPSKG